MIELRKPTSELDWAPLPPPRNSNTGILQTTRFSPGSSSCFGPVHDYLHLLGIVGDGDVFAFTKDGRGGAGAVLVLPRPYTIYVLIIIGVIGHIVVHLSPHDARLVIGAGIDPVHGLRGYDVGGAFFCECQAVSGKFTFTEIDRLQIT